MSFALVHLVLMHICVRRLSDGICLWTRKMCRVELQATKSRWSLWPQVSAENSWFEED